MPDPIYRRGADGSDRLIFDDEEIVVDAAPPDNRGRRTVDIVTSAGHYLARGLANLADEADRQRLAVQAGNRDGVSASEWDERLLTASVIINSKSRATNDWRPLVSLPTAPPTPSLDSALIHPTLRAWLTDITDRASIPLEYAATPAYVGLSSTIGRHVGIMPVRFDRHLVVGNLWGGIIGRPGTMKSMAVQEGLGPVNRLAATGRSRFKSAIEEYTIDAKMIEVVLSDKYTKESLGVGIGDHNEGDYYAYIDGAEVVQTSAQEEFLSDFFPQRSFYMSVYILEVK